MRYALFASLLFVGVGLSAQSDFETTTALFGDLRARQIGPAVMSGRVSCLAVHPKDATTVYIGAGGGGIWKTENAGATVEPIFDDHTQSIGAIALAPSDPEVVYVGTGEAWPRNSVSVGTGAYRSDDGGRRWRGIGLDSTERIARIAVHPNDPETVYVAALGPLWSDGPQRGIFKSTDGGDNWSRVLYLNEQTGAADIAMDPLHPDTLYAAMWSHRRTPDRFDSGYGGTSGLYRSYDGGENWTEVTGGGFPDETLGRIAVAIAPSNPDRIYASVETGSEDTKGMYRSDDGGESWTLTDRSFGNQVRPFYFARVVVDPANDSIVAKCAVTAMISEDAGERWRDFPRDVHSDYHDIYIDPANGRHMLVATDGGVYESYDQGRHFKMWQNLPLSQFYRVSVDNDYPYNIYGGLQDNGSWFGPSQSAGGISNADWRSTYGGDGFYSFRHPTKPHFVFAEAQGGALVRYDDRSGTSKSIAPFTAGEGAAAALRFNWNAPIHLSADGERLYFASQFLFLSDDDGESWWRISPDLTTNDTALQRQTTSGGLTIDNSGAENHTTIYTVAESPVDPQVIWVGTDDGHLQRTTDGGKTWTHTNENVEGLPRGSWVTSIEASPHDAATAYATFDNHRRGDMATYLYRTTDGGLNWERLTDDDLEGYALSVRQDPVNPNLLFLGTEFGLYISLDGGESWAPFRAGVPRVGIRDMVIHPRESDLVMGTHGRGVIILDDVEALRQITPELTRQKIAFLDMPPTYFYEGGGAAAGAGRYGSEGRFTGPNPSRNARVMYYAGRRHTFGKMYAEIYKDGELLRTLPAGKSKGLNIVSLPISLEKPKAPPSNNRFANAGAMTGPTLPEGTYELRLIKGKDTFHTDFTLAGDPRSPYTSEDRGVKQDVTMQLYHDVEELAYIYATLETIATRADSLERTKLATRAREMMGELVYLDGDGYVNEGSNLGEEVSTLFFYVRNFAGRPSVSQQREAERLHEAVREVRRRFDALRQSTDDEIDYPDKSTFLSAED